MPGAFFGIEIARRGMRVHQAGLSIIGHNVANASTPGYTRQAAVIQATNPHWVPSMDSYATPGQFGTGAEVSEIRRIKDEYLDNNVRQSTTSLNYWQSQLPFLGRSQALFSEPANEGVDKCITEFFKAWMDLNNSPMDTGTKGAVVQLGEQLASMLNNSYQQLENVAHSIAKIEGDQVVSGQLKDDVDRINDILHQIWDVTESIKRVYGVNQQPNDLLDRRDLLLQELSQYGPVKVEFAHDNNHKPNGELAKLEFMNVNINLPKNDEKYHEGNLTQVGLKVEDNKIILAFLDNEGNPLMEGTKEIEVNLTVECSNSAIGGSLLGMEQARQHIISDYQERLNKMVDQLIKKMPYPVVVDSNGEPVYRLDEDGNRIQGKNPDGSPAEDDDGNPIFEYEKFFTGELGSTDPKNRFQVNQQLLDDASKLDGKKASDAVKWRDGTIPELENRSFNQYYALLVTKVGATTRQADDMTANQGAINHQITALRDSVSGVAINEELSLMIQFQYGFQASARMVNTMDSMLDVVINRLF